MNEGHYAFLAHGRINILRKEKGLSFDAARGIVIARSVFITNTTVPARNDVFNTDLTGDYLGENERNESTGQWITQPVCFEWMVG